VPAALQRALVRPNALLRLTSDLASYREYMRLRTDGQASGDEVELHIGRLNGRPVWVREGTRDVDALWKVFIGRRHLPPARVQRRGMHLIWDLGAGIGLTMADMAVEFPDARIVGVEQDAANAALARRNFEPWDNHAGLIDARVPDDLSLNALLERTGGPVQFVRMDVGGAERELLASDTEWAAEVGCIKVEVHGDYTTGDCARDLEALGFRARPDRRHGAAVLGER
jgi:hypothetical protein